MSSLAAFCVPGDDGSRIVMIAAGWDDGRWAMAPCYHDGSHFYSLGGTNAGGERQGSKYPGPPDGAFDTLWEACSCGDLAAGDTQDMGAVLHIVYQVNGGHGPLDGRWFVSVVIQCVRGEGKGSCIICLIEHSVRITEQHAFRRT